MKTYPLLIGLFFSKSLMAQFVPGDLNIYEKASLEHQKVMKLRELAGVKALAHLPDNYKEAFDAPPFECSLRVFASATSFAFVKKDSSVFITIAIQSRDSVDYEKEKKFAAATGWPDPDDMWKIKFKAHADTTNSKYHYYSAKELKDSNADGGVEFSMTCPGVMYLDKYKIARAILVNKKSRGLFEIYYFIRQGAKVDINKELKNNSKMIEYLQ